MPSIFSRNRNRGPHPSISGPLGGVERSATGGSSHPETLRRPLFDQRSDAGSHPTSQPTPQYPSSPHQQPTSYSHEQRPPPLTDPNLRGPQHFNLQRSVDGTADPPASASLGTAHESPNIDHREQEPKRSIRERLGLTGASRENLLDASDEQSFSNRLRRRPSAAKRAKDIPNYPPQSPPSSGSGRVTPQLGSQRAINIPEEQETETDNLRDLASFFRNTAPSSDPRRRPISIVGDPSALNRNKASTATGEDAQLRQRPRSGSLGDAFERGPNWKQAEPLQTNPLQGNPVAGGPTSVSQPHYQPYHPQSGESTRQQPALPPLQTSTSPSSPPGGDDLHPQTLSPSRQQLGSHQSLAHRQLATESPPHFQLQSTDQQHHPHSLEHGAALELIGHLAPQNAVLGSAPRSAVASPIKDTGSGMPSTNASLQLPPRRGSVQDSSEPPTPNVIPSSRMQQPVGQGIQRAQTTAGESTGRSTPPPQQTAAKEMSEEEVSNLLQQFKELRDKYSKVKRYYFEKDAQVTTLQNALAHQKLSQSRTSWDDGEYMGRLQRLDGLISQMSYGFRKDWKSVPMWLQPFVNKDAVTVGKQEMTAVGRAFISRWLVDELFNKYFHPGLDLEVSKELKTIQNNIRGFGTAMQTGEEEEALTSKIINWRLATVDGLQQELNGPDAYGRGQHLIQLLDAQLVSSLTEYMQDTPAGLEGGVHMITELAVGVLAHLPFESRDVLIEYYHPGSPMDERVMKAETTPIAALTTPMAELMDSDRVSVHSERSDVEDEDLGKGERQDHRKGFLSNLVSSRKSPPHKSGSAGASQSSLLQPPGSSGGPKEDRVRLCVFLALAIRGKMVLAQAPVFKTV